MLQKAIPAGGGNPRDLMSTNPLLNVILKTTQNYDAFYNRPVWKDYNEGASGYTQYEGSFDKYEDKWLRDLSKRFDTMGLWEGGFPVTTTKSALGSLFTNMDRNPFNAIINHSYVAATGGLNEYEKEKYGNQMNLFLNDAFGPVTKRYVGNIDLLRNQKSELQAEADHMRETEDRFQANLRLAYRSVIDNNGIRKDPDTGNWITADGKVMRLEDGDGDGLYDAKDFFLSQSDIIINQVEDELKGRLGEDEI